MLSFGRDAGELSDVGVLEFGSPIGIDCSPMGDIVVSVRAGNGGGGIISWNIATRKWSKLIELAIQPNGIYVSDSEQCLYIASTEALHSITLPRTMFTASPVPRYAIITEFMRGGDLCYYVHKRHETLSLRDRLWLLIQLAEGLNTLHANGIIHREF